MDHKYKASVKIMRSYDYCHFEVCLGTDEERDLDGINEMRKEAALLADEAVRQYQIARKKEDLRKWNDSQKESLLQKIKFIEDLPESERTPEQAAILRGKASSDFWTSLEEEDYYYQDDPMRDHHFSMLRKFQKTVVKG
jgi:hypothetical protein